MQANDASDVPQQGDNDSSISGDTDGASVGMEMPRYKCHKEVWALKIKSIALDRDEARLTGRETDGSAKLTVEEPRYAPVKVSGDYMHKHKPHVGGYYVVYEDGYKSFSPAKAFEDGYTLIN